MINPDYEMKPGQRVSLPYELLNQVYALLSELPAKTSMQYLLAIQQEAEVIEEED